MKKFLLLTAVIFLICRFSNAQTYFNESFEGTWSGTLPAPAGWVQTHPSGTDSETWEKSVWTTLWTPAGNGTKPTGTSYGSAVAHFNDYNSSTGNVFRLETGDIDLSASTTPRISFYYFYSSGTAVLRLWASNNGGSTWANISGSIASTGSTWTKMSYSLASYNVSNARIALEVTSSYGNHDLWLDNLIIDESPLPLSGIYTIDPSGSGSTNFTTFSAAINALNEGGISAPVTFNVAAGAVFNEKPAAISATGTSVNTITFQKNGSGANPKLVPTGVLSSSPYDFGFCISGGDYITFDGIDVDASSATNTTNAIEYGYLIRNASATNGAQYNSIKNCSVTLNKNYIATTTGGCIFSSVSSSQGGVVPTNATGANSYNKYYNLTLQNAQNGVYLVGNTSYPDLSCEIGVSGSGCQSARNTITNMGGVYTFGSSYGIYTYGLSAVKIFNNDISNIRSNQSTTAGILCSTYLGISEIYSNSVSDISNSGSTSSTSRAAGIEVQNSSGTPTIRVYNNFVSDIKSPFTGSATANVYAYGIYVNNTSTATVSEIDNNSVHLFTTGTPTYSLACFAIANSSTAVQKVRGNVFVNAVGAQGAIARHTCWYSTSATAIGGSGSVSNYNDMFIKNDAGTSGFVGRGNTTYYNTVANWTTATTQDANSVSVDPAFTGNTNLHASAAGINAVAGFTPQTWVTTDIDCDDRSTTSPSDLGADAFNLASCAVPTGLTASNITYISADISWTEPGTGTPVGYEWEVRSSGAGGSGSTGLFASGSTTAPNVSASVSGLSGGTTYTMYVRTFCGGSDYSTWASNIFSTLNCNLPTGVVASAVTASSATITWVAPVSGSPEGYEWEVRSSGAAGSGSTGLAASGSTTSPVVTSGVSGLTSATAYSVYVRTMCYTGFYSSWTSAVTFTTLCAPISTLPHTEPFAIYLPNTCWNEGDLGDLTAGPTTISATASSWAEDGFLNSGSTGAAKINIDATGDNDWIISPQFSLPASPNQRLKYSVGATQWNGTVAPTTAWETDDYVQVLISTSGYTNWTVLKTFNNTNVPSHLGQIDILDLTAYAGQTISIAYRGVEGTSNGGADIDFFIDNFIIEELPSCVEPSALNATDVTLNSATLNWTPPVANPSSFFDIFLDVSSVPPTSGSTPIASVGSGISTYNTENVLTPNTTYYYWVRSDCGSGLTSSWAGPSTFFTGYCTPAPSSVDGDGITGVEYSSVNNLTGAEAGNYGNYTALIGDVSQGTTIPVYITYETGYTYDTKIWIDWNDDLDFTDSGEEVYTGTSLANNPTTLNASFFVPLTATLGNHRMRIGGVDVGPPTVCYNGTYGSFEDYTVNVILPPSCLSPSDLNAANITTIGADLSWSSPDSFFDIFIEMMGAPAPGSETIPTVDDFEGTNYSWNEGEPSTTYQFYVRTDCGKDNKEVSTWAGPFTFTTLCEVFEVPFSQNFDEVTIPAIPNCWTVQTGTVAWRTTDERGTYQPAAHSPYNCMSTFYNSSYAKNDWFFTPGINLVAGVTYKLSFWYLTDGGTYGPEKMEVKYGDSPTAAGMTAGIIWNNANMINATYQQAVAYFTPSSSNVYFLGWHAYSEADIDFISVDDIALTTTPSSTTWTGNLNSNWDDNGNWNNGIPGPNTDVTIPDGLTNYPTLNSAGWCRNFTIQSSTVGTGSILGNNLLTISGTTTIERYLTKYEAVPDFMFHFLSSPVSAQPIVPEFKNISSTNTDFYKWGESSNLWINTLSAPGTWNTAFENNFAVGNGYMVAYPDDLTKHFTGTMNDGDISPILSYTPAGSNGWNLIGNPYPSAIDWDLVSVSQSANLDNAVYVWDNANQNYLTWVGNTGSLVDGIIPSMQGFFVKANAASPALTLQNADRVHAASAFYKNSSMVENLVHLRIDGNSHHDDAFVRFNNSATTAFDGEWDAYKLSSGVSVPKFYSIANDTRYSVNTIPESSLSAPVSLNLEVGADAEYTVRMIENTLSADVYVTLEDLKTGTMQRLNNNPAYTFTAGTNDAAERFRLHFKDATSVQEPGDLNGITVYATDGIINILTDSPLSGKVLISDMAGRTIISTNMVSGSTTQINFRNHTGVYMVSVITSEGTVNQKILVR